MDFSGSAVKSNLYALGFSDTEYDAVLKTSTELTLGDKKHFQTIILAYRNDGEYDNTYNASIEDKVKIDNTDLTVSLHSDNGFGFVNAKLLFEVDSLTQIYIEYAPNLKYPHIKDVYETNLILLNPGLYPENDWLYVHGACESSRELTVKGEVEYDDDSRSFQVRRQGSGGDGLQAHIGKALAVALAEAGADIVGVSKELEPSGSDVEKAVVQTGRKFRSYQCDFRDRKATHEFTARVMADFPVIDILVANAGMTYASPRQSTPMNIGTTSLR